MSNRPLTLQPATTAMLDLPPPTAELGHKYLMASIQSAWSESMAGVLIVIGLTLLKAVIQGFPGQMHINKTKSSLERQSII